MLRLSKLAHAIQKCKSRAMLAGAAVAMAAASFNLPAVAQSPTPATGAAAFTQEQKSAIEKIVKEYLLRNPEVFLEVQQALESKMEKIQAERLQSVLKENATDIYRRANSPVAGNPQGDVTIVEFFDYNCGYCKKAFRDISKLVDQDKKVRLVLKELPILSRGSEQASRVALAAKMQGKYWEAHRALLTIRGEANEQTALRAVEKLGLDMAKLRKDIESPEVKGEIAFVRGLAQKMNVQGTPHFLVGDRSIAGAPGDLLEQISKHVSDLRVHKCSFC
ncbi:MAG: DsbA family protein [Hyphomicrobiaceae bacterium]